MRAVNCSSLLSPGRERLQMSIFHLRVHPPPQQRLQVCILYLQVHLPHPQEKPPHVYIASPPCPPQSSRCPRCFRVTVVAPFCDLPVRAQKEKKVTLHLTPVPRLMMWERKQLLKRMDHTLPKGKHPLKRTYCSLCQGEVVVESDTFLHFLLLKRNYPKENFVAKMGHWVDSGGRMLLGRGGPLNYSTQ